MYTFPLCQGDRQQRVLHLFQKANVHSILLLLSSLFSEARPFSIPPGLCHCAWTSACGSLCPPGFAKGAASSLECSPLSLPVLSGPQSWQSHGHHVFFSLFPARLTAPLTGLQHPLTLPTAETGAGHEGPLPSQPSALCTAP